MERRIEELRLAAEEMEKAAKDYMDALVAKNCSLEDIPARSQPALQQKLLDNLDEGEELRERAGEQLTVLQRLDEVDPEETEKNRRQDGAKTVTPSVRGGQRAGAGLELSASTGLLNPLLAPLLKAAREAREQRESSAPGNRETPTGRPDASTRGGRQQLRFEAEEAQRLTNTTLATEALDHKLALLEAKVQTLHAALLEYGQRPRPGPSVLAQLRQTVRDLKGEATQCRGERDQLAFRSPVTAAINTTFRDRLNTISDALETLTRMMERGAGLTEEASSANMPTGLIPPTLPPLYQSSTSHPSSRIQAASSPLLPGYQVTSTNFQQQMFTAGASTPSSQPSVTAGMGRAHLKRMDLPQFSGSIEEYLEFRETWHVLVAETYQNPSLYLLQLKNHIPKEAKNMLRGVTVVAEAWAVLDSHYGDRNAAVATVTANL